MHLFNKEWISAIENRRSRRDFNNQSLNSKDLVRLKKFAIEAAPVKGARAVVLEDGAAEVFEGMAGAYGGIKGCHSLAVFIADARTKRSFEDLGYLGEAVILEAEVMGGSTCWVGGTYRPEVAGRWSQLAEGEKIAAVAALGYTSGPSVAAQVAQRVTGTRSRKPLASLCSGLGESAWPAWIKQALGAALAAPSHMNRQPWRFEVAADSITVKYAGAEIEEGVNKRLECGIAMLHLETAAHFAGAKGTWEFLDTPGDVARLSV